MFILPSVIEGVATRRDKTLRITIGVNELPPEKAAAILALQNEFCYVAFKREDFGEQEKAKIEALSSDLDDTKKTPSQRLRGVLYKVWEQAGSTMSFEAYYLSEMERIIKHFKSKLD